MGVYTGFRADFLCLCLMLLAGGAWATDDEALILGYDPVALYVLNNDAAGTTLSDVSSPEHGTASVDGEAVIYTPQAGFLGQDSFNYTSSGVGGGGFTVNVDVRGNSLGDVINAQVAQDPVFAASFVADLKRELADNPQGATAETLREALSDLIAIDPWFEIRFGTAFRAATANQAIDLYVFLGEDNLQGRTETGDFNSAGTRFEELMGPHSSGLVLVLNCAAAGSSVVQWSSVDAPSHLSPSYLDAGRQLDWSNDCMAIIDNILENATLGATVKGLVIGLGQNDARIVAEGGPSGLIDTWQENLGQLVDLYRASYGANMTVLQMALPEAAESDDALRTAWQQVQQAQADFRSYNYELIETSDLQTWDDGTALQPLSDVGQRALAKTLVDSFLQPETPSLGDLGICTAARPCYPGSNQIIEVEVCNERNFFRRTTETRRVLCDQHGNSLHSLASACDGCIDLGAVAGARNRAIVTVHTGEAFSPTFYNRQMIDGALVEPVPYDNPFTTNEPRSCGQADRESSTFVLAPGSYDYLAESRMAEACDTQSARGCGLLFSADTALLDSFMGDFSVASGDCLAITLGEEIVPQVTFSTIQQSIFTPSCAVAGCHSGGLPPQGLNLSSGQAYRNIVGVRSTERPGLFRIEPGNADDSYLYQKILGTAAEGARMPLGRQRLSNSLVEQLRMWIEQGALDN